MAYTPTVWECGDTITAEKLNKLEQGVAQGGGSEPLIVEVVEYRPTCEPGCTPRLGEVLSATWQDMKDAIDEGKSVYYSHEVTEGGLTGNIIEPLEELMWAEGTMYAAVFKREAFDTETPTQRIVITDYGCNCGQD